MGDDLSRKAGNKEQKARERRNVSPQKVTLSAGIGVTGIGEIGVRSRLLPIAEQQTLHSHSPQSPTAARPARRPRKTAWLLRIRLRPGRACGQRPPAPPPGTPALSWRAWSAPWWCRARKGGRGVCGEVPVWALHYQPRTAKKDATSYCLLRSTFQWIRKRKTSC